MTSTAVPESLDEKLLTIARAERLVRAEVLVKNYTIGSAALALVPLPIVDQVALVALEIKMIHDLAGHYDVPFNDNIVTAILSSLLSGLTGGLLARGLSSIAKAVPVLGTLGGGGGIAVSSASVTFALGSVFIQHFEANGTLLNVDVEWLKTMMNKALKKEASTESEEPSKEDLTTTEAATEPVTEAAAA